MTPLHTLEYPTAAADDHGSALRTSLKTIVFTDVVASTAMLAALGDRAFARVLFAHNLIVRSEVIRHRGREVHNVGDGFMLTFPTVADAASCLLEIQQRIVRYNASDDDHPLHVRAGVHVGTVLTDGAITYIGLNVHVARRVVDLAAGGEILMTTQAAKQIDRQQFRVGVIRRVQLRGLDDNYEIAPILPAVEQLPVYLKSEDTLLISPPPSPTCKG